VVTKRTAESGSTSAEHDGSVDNAGLTIFAIAIAIVAAIALREFGRRR
jgi:hypothetical protein